MPLSVSIASVHIRIFPPLTLCWPPFSCRATQLQQLLTRIPSAFLPQTFAVGPRSPERRGAWKFAAAHLSISCGQPAEVSTSVSAAIVPKSSFPSPPLSTFSTDCSVPPFVSYLQSLAPAKPQNVFQTTKEHLGMRYTRSGIWGWLCSGGLAFVRFSKGVNIDTSLFRGRGEKFLGNFRFSTIRRDDLNQKIAWWWQQTLANWFGN